METTAIDFTTLSYRRQYYDAGDIPGTQCRLCGGRTRFTFILKNPSGVSTPIGDCCFHRFRESNPDLYLALTASLVLLRGQTQDIEKDTADQWTLSVIAGKEMGWREAKKDIRIRIREYRRLSGEKEWLPKPLFELQKELGEKPHQNYKNPLSIARWYERHASGIREKLSSISQ
jgi:hypothetical protein